MSAAPSARLTFDAFYRRVFLPEHRHPANIALHMAGVALSGALAFAAIGAGGVWLLALLTYPVVHAAPGLIGHRLFERDARVGDVRVTRADHPRWWFILANHRLAFDLLTGGPRR